MNILIRELSRRSTEQEILALFTPFGDVTAFNLVMDEKTGQSKGFGFAEMPDPDQAQEAIKALDGKKMRGCKIRVKPATRPGPKDR